MTYQNLLFLGSALPVYLTQTTSQGPHTSTASPTKNSGLGLRIPVNANPKSEPNASSSSTWWNFKHFMDFEGPKNSANTTISMWLSHLRVKLHRWHCHRYWFDVVWHQVDFYGDVWHEIAMTNVGIRFWQATCSIKFANSVPGAFVVTRSLPLFQGLFCIMYDEFIPKSCGSQNSRCWLHEDSHEAGHSSIGLSVMDGEKVYRLFVRWFALGMMTKAGKDTDNKNICSYRFDASVILSPGTGVDKSVYTIGLGQLPPPLPLCRSCWAPWKGATQMKNLLAKQEKKTICGLSISTPCTASENISLRHSHMLSEGHKRRCFGAKWRRSSPGPNAERLGVYNNMVLPTRIFGLIERSITPEIVRFRPSQFSNEFSLGADIWCAWNTKACIDINQQRP